MPSKSASPTPRLPESVGATGNHSALGPARRDTSKSTATDAEIFSFRAARKEPGLSAAWDDRISLVGQLFYVNLEGLCFTTHEQVNPARY
ncbi:hypothetical protein CVT25_005544 [Psilocybe cyanescens]|uniref:Uncharacterized protein n=1 Tax=Psilocybe cyanescens TaxID=93625 RepID=A0A409VQV4_PSICY|nr:hypothetical protein CVT25_005544 [Psilocybe cyanescens]